MAITIQPGDTLSGLARKHNSSVAELARINGIKNVDLIFAGAQLKLPGDVGGARPGGKPSALGLDQAAPVRDGAAPAAGDAPYINQYHPAGEANGYTNGGSNCGPTSMAMIARAFGKGEGMSDAQFINHLGAKGGTSANGTGVNGIGAMAASLGLGSETRAGADVGWIAEQIKAGKKVVANGDYYAMAPHGNAGKVGTGGHYVAVVGQDADGNFIVNDPADKNVRTVSPADLAQFIKGNANGGYQISVG